MKCRVCDELLINESHEEHIRRRHPIVELMAGVIVDAVVYDHEKGDDRYVLRGTAIDLKPEMMAAVELAREDLATYLTRSAAASASATDPEPRRPVLVRLSALELVEVERRFDDDCEEFLRAAVDVYMRTNEIAEVPSCMEVDLNSLQRYIDQIRHALDLDEGARD